jgi:hypothetical protein
MARHNLPAVHMPQEGEEADRRQEEHNTEEFHRTCLTFLLSKIDEESSQQFLICHQKRG